MNQEQISPGAILSGPFFSEPMRVETVRAQGVDNWVVGLVGTQSERFRSVTLSTEDLATLSVMEPAANYQGDGHLLQLGLQAYSLGIAYEFDPFFGLSMSRVDPLPHQLSAVYDHLLKLGRIRFLLADDAGAGKTIMAGLLLRELKLRGLVERTLIVCPANLAFQWQRELRDRFSEWFRILRGSDIREQFGANQWLESGQLITSLDLAKREDILPGLQQVHWDLVIVDEAHRMSWTPPSAKTARYALGELLRDTSDHFLLLTATPHKGDPANFNLFLQLLDRDAYADVRSIQEAMQRRRAPFYLRRVKEAMVHFPERQPDGTWAAQPLFKKRIPSTADFAIDGAEHRLYRDVTNFVKRNSRQAAQAGDDPRARAVGFLMALFQRRLASSVRSLRCSLERRADRLERALAEARDIASEAPHRLPDPEDLEEMEEAERERWERVVEAVTLAANADQVRAEIAELRDYAEQAAAVEATGEEAKLAKLEGLLRGEGFFDNPDQRLIIFTEFRDTLDYLVEKLKAWGFRVGVIHGGMHVGQADIPGTRLHAEQQFWNGETQVLVATEAAGEGINLHCCHILFNYDIPWNPNRLEQRMGRIHRYGQQHDCLIFNFVATNTIEGQVLRRLLEKLQEIRDALEDDAVFNVVGEVLPAAHVERVLRDYYAGELGDADLEDRLLRNVDERHFRDICQTALEGLATRSLNLAMLVERRAQAQERRIVPETVARFLGQAAEHAKFQLTAVASLPHTFQPGATPTVLHRYQQRPTWRLPEVRLRYPRLTTDRRVADQHNLEWVTPGHPLFEALRLHALDAAQEAWAAGATFYSVQHDEPARVEFYRAQVVDGLGRVVHERLFAVELAAGAEPRACEPTVLGDLVPADELSSSPPADDLPESTAWLHDHLLRPFLEEVRAERLPLVERVAEHVELSLTELLAKVDEELGRAEEGIETGVEGAEGRKAQAEARHAQLLARREARRLDLQRQRTLSLQNVERLTSVLVLPHPDRNEPEIHRLRPNPETEGIAMRVVIEHEEARGCKVFDVHEKNLGYDVTSLDVESGELRLIEVKGLAAETGTVILTPNERRVAEDRRECFWLYVVTGCATDPTLRDPIQDPARLPWHEVTKVQHYWLELGAAEDVRQPRAGE